MSKADDRFMRKPSWHSAAALIQSGDAMRKRISHRRFLSTSLTDNEREALERLIEHCNRRSGLHVSLVCNRADPFVGHLTNARCYIVFAGQAGDIHLEEKCGYFGEQIILAATDMGLATCWVGGTYDKSACLCHLAKGERLVCVAAVGHAASTTSPHLPHRSTKSIAELSEKTENALEWFFNALAAVQLAPSAMNRQGVLFRLLPNDCVCGIATDDEPFSLVDLGIAKLHFELGAHGGDWDWGSGGIFRRAIQETSCGAVVWREQDGHREYLLIRHNGGHWSFPKGHMEEGETEEQTAYREILEETGLTTCIDTGFRHIVTYAPKSGVIKDVIFFLGRHTGGTEHPQEEEIAQLGWYKYDMALDVITFPTDTAVLAAAEETLQKKDA